ncbi:pimelyl-ACP methyl ester esterase BioV [Nitratiruptor sp. SB155-2]|uniref:pimelyl-ACP methyl ester esterase BioV n=1 Tax=Nitratiruptor sp. (strain SB155-2) TaxID=387092 RepID=UPI00015873E7|nr:pimelyl-ACP methyl ester esterase BioV [Nitratiruptor sp. SB155-2]BAF70188.1 conserved hypothetical protein [Nitratiruptor sp. SB155-2]
MQFFSGFGFHNEKILFLDILNRSDFTIAGFSYGAQKAFQEAVKQVQEGKRVDTLQLISPAYFDEESKEFKHKQILSFVKNQDAYLHFFYKKAAYPSKKDYSKFFTQPSLGDLKALLFFTWDDKALEFLVQSGVHIEVFIGALDKIVNPQKSKHFFQQYGQVYYIKDVGHLLRGSNG